VRGRRSITCAITRTAIALKSFVCCPCAVAITLKFFVCFPCAVAITLKFFVCCPCAVAIALKFFVCCTCPVAISLKFFVCCPCAVAITLKFFVCCPCCVAITLKFFVCCSCAVTYLYVSRKQRLFPCAFGFSYGHGQCFCGAECAFMYTHPCRRHREGMELHLQSFLTSPVDNGKWLTQRPGFFGSPWIESYMDPRAGLEV
jgi:hypothetical protein